MDAVRRVSRRLSGRSGGAKAASEEDREKAAVQAMLAPWLEEAGLDTREQEARRALGDEILRAHVHRFRFATAEEEMAWIHDEADAGWSGWSFRREIQRRGISTPSALWQASASATENNPDNDQSLSFLASIGPNVVVGSGRPSRKVSRLPDDWTTPGSLRLRKFAPEVLPRGLRVTGALTFANAPVDGDCVPGLADVPVGGSLCFYNTAIAQLPASLNVAFNLELVDCMQLTSLPPGLVVERDLYVRNCAVEELPEDASVSGVISIVHCHSFTRLPEEVSGGLRVVHCDALESLPLEWAGGVIDGDFEVRGCAKVKAIPPVHVRGSIRIVGTPLLAELPPGIKADGSLHIHDCPLLTELPWEELDVGGDALSLRKLPLKRLPALSVAGDLVLDDLELEALPEELRVGGALRITSCHGISTLPAPAPAPADANAWEVGGDVVLSALNGLSELPDGFRVAAGLSLSRCRNLGRLPAELHVRGELDCSHCVALAGVGDGLVVDGHAIFKGCALLEGLPARASFGGDLVLTDCVALTALPHGLDVPGRLAASRCRALAALPSGLRVGASLMLRGASALELLPAGLQVPGGTLDVNGCSLLRELPAGLLVGGERLDISGTAVEAMPAGLVVEGELVAKNCPRLASIALSPDAALRGAVLLNGCAALHSVPDDWHVLGNLNLDGCSLTALPAGLKVDGALWARDCQGLTSLPADLVVGRHLELDRCRNFTSMPTMPEVGGYLSFTDTALVELPEVLTVRRSLFAERTPLASLPRELHVGHSLRLEGCAQLTALPEVLTVAKDVHISGCPLITRLPDCCLEWAAQDNGRPHDVYLGGSGLPPEEIARVRAANPGTLRFHVSLDDDARGGGDASDYRSAGDFPTLEEAAEFWKEQAAMPDVQLPLGVFVEAAYLRGVLTFLSKLRRSKEYTNIDMRKGLACRIVEVMELVTGEDNGVREELLVRMTDSIDACGDKPIWALNQMQLLVQVCKARGDREALKELGRAVMRLEVVHRHVRMAMDAMNFVDDVCVYLRFEIALREPLDLPVSALDMIYPNYITVTQEAIDAAKKEALALTDEEVDTWLPTWSEWQRQDRVDFAEKLDFAALKRNSTKRLSLSLRGLLGNKIADPVRVRPAKAVWSLVELMKHWVNTGMDLNNTPRDVDYMRLNLTKCI